MSLLNQLKPTADKKQKRVGRGYGSGKGGHTSGKGTKGQNSRQGGGAPLWFEGGQLPLIKRLPMLRGKGRLKVVRPVAEVTLTTLQKMSAQEISLDTLKIEKVIDKRYAKAKIIATGSIQRSVTIKGLGVTAKAREAIEAQGGSVVAEND
jgi:large subunit ribosomal protein L15